MTSDLNRDAAAGNAAMLAFRSYVVVDLVHDVVLDHANPAGGAYPPPNVLRKGDLVRISAGGGQFVEIRVDRLLA